MIHLNSYKLWYGYLKLRRKQVRGHPVSDPCYEEVNNAFERSLAWMHKVSFGPLLFVVFIGSFILLFYS